MTEQEQIYFDAVLHPHRSLNRMGFLVVMAMLSVFSFAAGMVFLLHGAWPVFGFFGLDVALIYVAFRLNFRDGRQFETVTLTDRTLALHRVAPDGHEQDWRFEPYWARVGIDPDGRLTLVSHGRRTVFGVFLNEEERESFRDALAEALHRWRSRPAQGAAG